jgi:hypothetical protein
MLYENNPVNLPATSTCLELGWGLVSSGGFFVCGFFEVRIENGGFGRDSDSRGSGDRITGGRDFHRRRR